MAQYEAFIPENTALSGSRRIGIYNSNGLRVGQISLGTLTPPPVGKRLYSFGALSDIHIGDVTASEDFKIALEYLSKETDFICISGDMIHNNNTDQPVEYKRIVDTYATVPVYACAGNHDAGYFYPIENNIASYTGRPLYYSVTHGEDVFIFVGNADAKEGGLFTRAELQWLYETLETNRNKRCFLFQHVRPQDGCGNTFGIYTYDIWGGTEQTVFESLLRHYRNVVFFHGHSHLKFDLQQYSDIANLDKQFGCWSVHIPSLSVPRGVSSLLNPSLTYLTAESEGYVVDVYENGIHLRGRNFVNEEFLPIASYWLDTTLQTIPAGTYTDSTGTIVT